KKFHGGFMALITPLEIRVVQTAQELRCERMTQEEFCQYPTKEASRDRVYSNHRCNWTGPSVRSACNADGKPLPSPVLANGAAPSNGATSSA
ncbi:hypothetical protein PMAYCL1PPCAC_14155, partial [Pristionchus mayeri]